jgi:hypothetical protein
MGRVFTDFWKDYWDTLAGCYVLFKIGYAPLQLPDVMRSIYARTGHSKARVVAQRFASSCVQSVSRSRPLEVAVVRSGRTPPAEFRGELLLT